MILLPVIDGYRVRNIEIIESNVGGIKYGNPILEC